MQAGLAKGASRATLKISQVKEKERNGDWSPGAFRELQKHLPKHRGPPTASTKTTAKSLFSLLQIFSIVWLNTSHR